MPRPRTFCSVRVEQNFGVTTLLRDTNAEHEHDKGYLAMAAEAAADDDDEVHVEVATSKILSMHFMELKRRPK